MKGNDIERYKTVIKSDVCSVREEFSNLLLKDLSLLLTEYFNFDGKVKLDIAKSGNALMVDVCFCASSLKYFNKLPK